MGAQLRAVRRRIRSVQSTAKITRAQELIATSRMPRAQQRFSDAEPYAREITRAVTAVVSRSGQVDHPLTRPGMGAQRSAVLVLTSDRGFCGGYNANVLREKQALTARLREENGSVAVPYVAGQKGVSWHRFREMEIAQQWTGFSETPSQANAEDITGALLDAFASPTAEGGVDEIYVVYTEFISRMSQRPAVRRLLPLEVEETTEEPAFGPLPVYEFEPSPEHVLDALLPWYIESLVFHALLDAAAAEIAARSAAMRAATDNAHELIDRLSLEANKARQAEITQEISEIVSGANALAETTAGR